MSSSQEDLSKMSVKVINLPFVIVFAKLYQGHKESSLSPEKKNSKSNNNNDNNNNISWLKLACSAGVFVLELAVVSSPPYWLEQSRWGGGGEKRKKTPARKGCENEKHPLISCASQIFRKWLIGQSKWTENYIIFPIKTNTREESTCYLQTSARIERVNYVVQKCLKRTLMIIVGFARFLSKWNLEI